LPGPCVNDLQYQPLHEAGIEISFNEFAVAHDPLMKGDGRFNPLDDVFVEGAGHPVYGLFPRLGMDDELGDHRVVVREDLVLVVDGAVDPDPHSTGCMVAVDLAGEGGKLEGILGVDAALDGVAGDLDVGLFEAQRDSGGATNLFLDDIDAGDHFGDRVLDLNAGVHLHEIEVSAFVEEELDGADAGIVDSLGGGHGGGPHLFPELGGQDGAGSLLEEFLMTPLDGTVALAEMDNIAVFVGHDLNLDVTGALAILFDVDVGIAEAGLGL